ncbi:hypothetical protein CR513_33121, partial [Mucuna pruriens]
MGRLVTPYGVCIQSCVYGFNPLIPLDLLPMPNVSNMLSCDGIAKAKLVKELHIARDLVWVHLRKDRFPNLRKSKLLSCGDGPFKIIKKISDNAYILEMLQAYEESTFDSNLRANSFEERELDKDLHSPKEDT